MGGTQIWTKRPVEKNTGCSEELESNSSSLDECSSSDESEDEGDLRFPFLKQTENSKKPERENDGSNSRGLSTNLEIRRTTDSGGQDNGTVVVKKSKEVREMVENVDKMSALKRYSHIRGILLEITDVVNNKGKNGLREEDAVVIMRYVVQWLRDSIDQRSLLAVDIKEKCRLKELFAKLSRVLKQLESRKVGAKYITMPSLAPCRRNLNDPAPNEVNATCYEGDNQKRTKEVKQNATTSQETITTAKVPLEQSTATTVHPPVVRTVKPLPNKGKPPAYYTTMINKLKETPMQRRVQCISHVLFQLKNAMLEDAVGQQKWQIPDSVAEVLEWISKGFDVRHDFNVYHDFAIVLFSYAAQHPEAEALQRITDQFSEVIDKIRSGSFTAPHNSLNSPAHHNETNSSDSHGSSTAKSTTKSVNAETGSQLGDTADEMRKSKSESEHESESESESDYDDEKEAIGGCEAAWNRVMAAARKSEF